MIEKITEHAVMFYFLTLISLFVMFIIEKIIQYIYSPQIIFDISDGNGIQKLSKGSAGWDIFSFEECRIPPRTRKLIKTNLYLKYLPNYLYLRIAPRSGLSVKGIDIGAGVIDSDYKGEIKVLVINNSNEEFIVEKDTRIAQFIPEKISNMLCYFTYNKEYIPFPHSRKERDINGFGSTGK